MLALAGCLGDDASEDSMGDEESMDDSTDSMGDTDGSMDDDESMDDEDSMDDEESMDDDSMESEPTDPAEAPRATIDRFSEAAGSLQVRSAENDLPGPDEPIDFDQGPFITQGLGPDGEVVRYYNFDVQPVEPAPIYAFVRENGDPVDGQLNVVGVIPGDDGYNDFWHVHLVTVPDGYEANSVTSVDELMSHDFSVEATDVIKNCPIVPDGSTASERFGDGDTGLVEGWYDGQVVSYFLFEEAPLETTGSGRVPLSPIYVTFNTNPGEDSGGPASGFVTESGSDQTHNVVASLPGDSAYSPLWSVNVYDNADFEAVSDLDSATAANVLDTGVATVNCPIVSVETKYVATEG